MIYFIQDSLTFRIKIGFTGKDDAKARLAELQTGSSSLLYLLATREGDKLTEQGLHKQFARFHAQGEWFNPAPELIQYVVGCSAVLMAREAVGEAVKNLVARSFPETKAEAERRVLARYKAQAKAWLEKHACKLKKTLTSKGEVAYEVVPKDKLLSTYGWHSDDRDFIEFHSDDLVDLLIERDGEPSLEQKAC